MDDEGGFCVMTSFFRLIRWLNLLIVALIFYALFFGIAQPVSKYYGYIILVSQLQFGFLVVAFLMLAAAGYIINDYFDRKADLINRPDTVVIGVHIKRRWAIVLHTLFNAIGIALGFAVSVSVGMWWFGFLFVLFSLLLWWYSSNLKRIPLLGNLLVAVLAGVVPMVFAGFLFYGSIHVSESYNVAMNDVLKHIFNLSLGFAVFAFLFSFIREIVKDSEDVKGDRAMYC
ncbi:MAG TPA: UbiA family prenyltransferase, partial [Bacteroidales bacterium]|nr:UbiA family prenyltransferase [Bacteroidales bacterium]